MIRRFWSALLVLCFVVAGLVVVTPTTAIATTTWPVTVDGFAPTTIQAYADGSFAAIACRGDLPTDPNARYYSSDGEVRSSLPGSGSPNGTYCREDAGYGAGDGTQYGWRNTPGNTTELVAWKNDRQLWTADISAPIKCNQYGSYSDKQMMPTSISEGSDGRIFMVLVPNGSARACDDRLVGLDPQTGIIDFDVALGTGPAGGSGLGYAPPTAWTYHSDIIAIDRSGVVRAFGYDGVEDSSAAFQLAIPSGHIIDKVTANDAGTVFAATSPTWVSGQVHLLYRTRSGSDGDITDTSAGAVVSQLQATNDGNVVAIWGNPARIDHFDISADTVSATYPTPLTTAGYSNYALQAYLLDEVGNEVWMWSHWDNTSGNQGVSVEVFDAALSSTSVVFLKEKKPADASNYPEFFERSGGFIRDAIADGTLYLATCPHDSTTCYTDPASASMNIHKIDVGPFGTALGKGFARNTYDSQKLEYVAMGDSFSSGEGNPDFNPWTDNSGVNECHRSKEYAYASLLADDPTLGLELVDFVACSGATMDTVSNGASGSGSWDEPSQLSALSDTTGIVTLTVGGNDVAFSGYAQACIVGECGPGSPVYELVTGAIASSGYFDKLKSLLLSTLQKAPNAQVLLVGYPHVTPTDPSDPYCLPFQTENDGGVTDAVAARSVVDSLNSVGSSVVSSIANSRLVFVSVTEAGNPFEGHDICAEVPSFVYPQITPIAHWLHPNHAGQMAYADVIAAKLSE